MIDRKIVVTSGLLAGLLACWADFLALFILGTRYPGYSHMTNTWSSLGASASPVSGIISLWWIIMGFLFLWFALGFRLAFREDNTYVKTATWILILYGLGEGAGSGLFKADHTSNLVTVSTAIHNFLGGIGTASILILPLVMLKIIPWKINRRFYTLSWIVFLSGCILLILFLSRYICSENFVLVRIKGLWQRLFVLDYYLYLTVIILLIIRRKSGIFHSG
jgi:hypothetical protein